MENHLDPCEVLDQHYHDGNDNRYHNKNNSGGEEESDEDLWSQKATKLAENWGDIESECINENYLQWYQAEDHIFIRSKIDYKRDLREVFGDHCRTHHYIYDMYRQQELTSTKRQLDDFIKLLLDSKEIGLSLYLNDIKAVEANIIAVDTSKERKVITLDITASNEAKFTVYDDKQVSITITPVEDHACYEFIKSFFVVTTTKTTTERSWRKTMGTHYDERPNLDVWLYPSRAQVVDWGFEDDGNIAVKRYTSLIDDLRDIYYKGDDNGHYYSLNNASDIIRQRNPLYLHDKSLIDNNVVAIDFTNAVFITVVCRNHLQEKQVWFNVYKPGRRSGVSVVKRICLYPSINHMNHNALRRLILECRPVVNNF